MSIERVRTEVRLCDKRRAFFFETINELYSEFGTYKKVAKALGISEQYLSLIRTDKKNISDKQIDKIFIKSGLGQKK